MCNWLCGRLWVDRRVVITENLIVERVFLWMNADYYNTPTTSSRRSTNGHSYLHIYICDCAAYSSNLYLTDQQPPSFVLQVVVFGCSCCCGYWSSAVIIPRVSAKSRGSDEGLVPNKRRDWIGLGFLIIKKVYSVDQRDSKIQVLWWKKKKKRGGGGWSRRRSGYLKTIVVFFLAPSPSSSSYDDRPSVEGVDLIF